jgi:SAM-dependent methyltransferase
VARLRRGSVAGVADHWERVWTDRKPGEVSWYESSPRSSLKIIEGLRLPPDAPIIDVGGGASQLAEELLARGYTDITVADISSTALDRARKAFTDSDRVEWVVADICSHDFGRQFALWHDRAVFHFMVMPEDRGAYLETLRRSLEPGGHVVMATFGPQGPTECSGLPVVRYAAGELADTLGYELVSSHLEDHTTPGGTVQQFLYAELASE